MQVNVKKFSLLGLVLMGASAITAAVLPSNKSNAEDKRVQNGELTQTSGAGASGFANAWSCKTRDVISGVQEAANCFDTDSAGVLSSTTRASENSSDDTGVGGLGNNPNTTAQDIS